MFLFTLRNTFLMEADGRDADETIPCRVKFIRCVRGTSCVNLSQSGCAGFAAYANSPKERARNPTGAASPEL